MLGAGTLQEPFFSLSMVVSPVRKGALGNVTSSDRHIIIVRQLQP